MLSSQVLTLVDATIILIFFKTIFLVIVFSLLHGIVFLPILLTVAMPREKRIEGQQPIYEKRFSPPFR